MRYMFVLLAILSGCTVVQRPLTPEHPPGSVSTPDQPAGISVPDASQVPAPEPAPASPPAARRENMAVASLMERARTDSGAGRLGNAAASLERALRIEPRNPRLWHELARVRLLQGDYAQAESTAARANSWVGGDATLRAQNWRLIAQAREARGNYAGARTALEAADRQR